MGEILDNLSVIYHTIEEEVVATIANTTTGMSHGSNEAVSKVEVEAPVRN